MKQSEIIQLTIAFFVLSIVIGFSGIINKNTAILGTALFYAFLILCVSVGAKRWAANALDADVEHELWSWSRYGMKPGDHLRNPLPLGAILPLILTFVSLGVIKCGAILTYETSPMKRRAARRFGNYSFTEITDWHSATIGAVGIGAVLLLATITYFIPGLYGLPTVAIYYAFWNMIPLSKLDGAQIFFGSPVMYAALATITLLFTIGTFLIV